MLARQTHARASTGLRLTAICPARSPSPSPNRPGPSRESQRPPTCTCTLRPFGSWTSSLAPASSLAHTVTQSAVPAEDTPVDVSVWWDAELCPLPAGVSGVEALRAIYHVGMRPPNSAERSDAPTEQGTQPQPGGEDELLALRVYGDWSNKSSRLHGQLASQPATLLDAPYEGVSTKNTSDIRLMTDAVAFAVAYRARFMNQTASVWVARKPQRRLRLVLVLGTGDYEYTIRQLRNLGHEIVLIMSRPPSARSDTHSVLSRATKSYDGPLDWQQDVLRPPLTTTPLNFWQPPELPLWAPFLQRPATIGRSAVIPASGRKTGGLAKAYLPLLLTLARRPRSKKPMSERELALSIHLDSDVTGTQNWTEYLARATRLGLINSTTQPRSQGYKKKTADIDLALRHQWYKTLIELEFRSYPTVQAAAAACASDAWMPWSDQQSAVACWTDEPVEVFAPLVETMSIPGSPNGKIHLGSARETLKSLPPHVLRVAKDADIYLELALQAGLLSATAWSKGKAQLVEDWWHVLYRLHLASLLRPNTRPSLGYELATNRFQGVGGQAIVTADLAMPLIRAVSHFHQIGTWKPTQEQVRRHIAEHDPFSYRRAGVVGWDDYVSILQDADLIFDDGEGGMSLQTVWYTQLIKLELVAGGSLKSAVEFEATRALRPLPWSPRQEAISQQIKIPVKALSPFISEFIYAQRGGRSLPTNTLGGMSELISPKAYRLAGLPQGDAKAFLTMAENAGIVSLDHKGDYFLLPDWWTQLYRLHLATLSHAQGLSGH